MNLYDAYILITGILVAIACSLIGVLLVVRKMAMISDAISHAVLPGIVAAYLLTGSRDSIWVMSGAMLAGLCSTLLIDFLHKKAKLQTDASIGVTFTWLFAAGVILLSAYAGQVDLDQDCVLYGEIALSPFDVWMGKDGIEYGPISAWIMGGVILVILMVYACFYKQLMITSFDPDFAKLIGLSNTFWNQVIMALVSITTIAAFESVGAILVVALMVVPPAAAWLLTRDWLRLLLLSVVLGSVSAIGGYYLAVFTSASIAGCMGIVAGFELMIAVAVSKLKAAV